MRSTPSVNGSPGRAKSPVLLIFTVRETRVWSFVEYSAQASLAIPLLAHLIQPILIPARAVTPGQFRTVLKTTWQVVNGLPRCW
jgi:hypothetical protein